jgi:hypothetical protein
MNSWKNLLIISLCFLMVAAMSLPAQDKIIVTVGGSYWYAGYSWEDNNGKEMMKLDRGHNFGPNLSITRNKWNFGLSYLTGKYPIKQTSVGRLGRVQDVDVTRGDLNVTIGYRVHPIVNVFAGIKHLKWSWEKTIKASIMDEHFVVHDANYKYVWSGPLFGGGVSIAVPLGTSGLYAFGSLAAMAGTITYTFDGYDMTGEPKELESDFASTLAALNIGLGYRFPNGFGITGAYRGDFIFQKSDDNKTDWKQNMRVQGVILTVSYSFK